MHEYIDKQYDENNKTQGKSENIKLNNDDDNQEKDSEVTETNQIEDNQTRINFDQGSFNLQNRNDNGSSSIDNNNLTFNPNNNVVVHDNDDEDKNENLTESKMLVKEFKRLKAWEKGSMDYLGLDSFDNIQRKLDQAIGLSNLTHKNDRDNQTTNRTKQLMFNKLSNSSNSLPISVGKPSVISNFKSQTKTTHLNICLYFHHSLSILFHSFLTLYLPLFLQFEPLLI